MEIDFAINVRDNGAYPGHDSALETLCDYLLRRVGRYQRIDTESAEQSATGRTRFERRHTFKTLIVSRQKATLEDIDTHIKTLFGTSVVFINEGRHPV